MARWFLGKHQIMVNLCMIALCMIPTGYILKFGQSQMNVITALLTLANTTRLFVLAPPSRAMWSSLKFSVATLCFTYDPKDLRWELVCVHGLS